MSLLVSLAMVIPGLYLVRRGYRRLQLSLAKHGSLTGHSRVSQLVARMVPGYSYDATQFFSADDAPESVVAQRKAGFSSLATALQGRAPATLQVTKALEAQLSDVAFVDRYRVPFQFRNIVRERLAVPGVVTDSDGIRLRDLDGNWSYDLSGAYGVNLFGYDFYKGCIDRGVERARALGPVLGPYHPVIADNAERLCAISGGEEVSFHMSGTEAVMQAVRLARYHTGRSHVVRFSGAYHGWWDGVQPGAGNPRPPHEVYTLAEMANATLRVLETRTDIACVLVNPLQGLHPNAGAPSDSTLIASKRTARFDRDAYTEWLMKLRDVCTRRKIVLIFDEVFMGFRLARGGAQEYFGVRADLVTYGKTLGGGFPIGVVCGPRELMRRYKEDRPADVCFARGTFNSHPYVMTAMNEFLRFLDTDDARSIYENLERTWSERTMATNRALQDAGVPVRVAALSSVWTVIYTTPGRYNWMLQFYLRAAGLQLAWIGTGRFIFPINLDEGQFREIVRRFVSAATSMQADGWLWDDGKRTNAAIGRRVLREMLTERFGARVAKKSPTPRQSHAIVDGARR